jgi:hypothetical protein
VAERHRQADAESAPARLADPGAAIAVLRQQGAWRLDPVRFCFIEALARRAESRQGSVRQLLEARLDGLIRAYEERFAQAGEAADALLDRAAARHPDAVGEWSALRAAGDLAGLRRAIAAREAAVLGKSRCALPLAPVGGEASFVADGLGDDMQGELREDAPDEGGEGRATEAGAVLGAGSVPRPAPPGELKSLRYFRDSWSKLHVERQLREILARRPENAGPLNSHLLMLRALERMRDLSPAYLTRFMAHAEALLGIDHALGFDVPEARAAAPAREARPRARRPRAKGGKKAAGG